MIRNMMKSAMLAAAALGAIAATPAAAQRYDRGGYDYSYRGDNSRWDGNRNDRYDRGRSYRRDRDDDRGNWRDRDHNRHRHWRGRDRYDRYDR